MSTELSNLLPASRTRAFRRQYFVRLLVVSVCLLSFVLVLHSLLLIPSYMFAKGEVERSQAELLERAASSTLSEETELTSRIAALSASVNYLSGRENVPQASAAIKAVLEVPRPGVTISGFTFTAPTASAPSAKLGISGVASSRDTLRQYAAALGKLPFVTSADLPISAYAQERDIPFTITLTGSLKP